jgi:excisionase family DNA binding protein
LVRINIKVLSQDDGTVQNNRKLLAAISAKSPLPERQTYSVKEVADLLGVNPKTVYRLLDRQLLRSLKSLRHHRIPRDELARFLRENL